MLNYVHHARDVFNKNKDKKEYIALIWDGIKKNAREEHITERATTIFLTLYSPPICPRVSGTQIFKTAERKYQQKYNNPNSHGLWPWLEKNGNAAVIKQEKDGAETWYSVFDEFYPVLREVVTRSTNQN